MILSAGGVVYDPAGCSFSVGTFGPVVSPPTFNPNSKLITIFFAQSNIVNRSLLMIGTNYPIAANGRPRTVTLQNYDLQANSYEIAVSQLDIGREAFWFMLRAAS